jgi:hypothetical protein
MNAGNAPTNCPIPLLADARQIPRAMRRGQDEPNLGAIECHDGGPLGGAIDAKLDALDEGGLQG